MKRILISVILINFIVFLASCEKDDICVEGDTPLLVVGFFDDNAEDDNTAKNVENLGIIEIQGNLLLNTIGSVDSIAFPLRSDTTRTSFQLIRNAQLNEEDGNTTITGEGNPVAFTYVVNRSFVSRACGFVANYNQLDTLRDVSDTDWIKRIDVVTSDIENSNMIHVKIFH